MYDKKNITLKFIVNNSSLKEEYEKYPSTYQKIVDFNNLYAINSRGYVNPFESWRIDAGFKIFF